MTNEALAHALKVQERIGGPYVIDLPDDATVDIESDPTTVLVTIPAAGEDLELILRSAARPRGRVQLARGGAPVMMPMAIGAVEAGGPGGALKIRLLLPPPVAP